MLSVVIVAKNEEKKIGMVIEAVRSLADEIIVVDSGSTDDTVKIAEKLGAKCQFQEWLGYAAQKNLAMSLATNDWILSLDADEVLTRELQEEIIALMKSDDRDKYDGYKIPRMLLINKTPVRWGGFYPDAQLRLIKKDAGKFNDRKVHEAIKINGPVKTLQNYMLHYSYDSVDEFANAMDKFARLSAEEYKQQAAAGDGEHKDKYKNPLSRWLHPGWTFLYRYFIRGGIMDGALGLKLALEYSNYVGKKIKYTREA